MDMQSRRRLEANAELRIGAETVKQLFDEYVRAGFTRKEAMELIKCSFIAQGGRR